MDGNDLSLFSCGTMVSPCIIASNILKKEYGISCRVIDMYSIKPIDKDLIHKCVKEAGSIVSAEEHSIIGGLGSSISDVTSEYCPTFVKKLGIRDMFGESARDDEIDQLFDKYGLSSKEIVKNVVELIKSNRK